MSSSATLVPVWMRVWPFGVGRRRCVERITGQNFELDPRDWSEYANCVASHAVLRIVRAVCDLLDAPTALAACCGFDLCHKYILYLYLYVQL